MAGGQTAEAEFDEYKDISIETDPTDEEFLTAR
jgi:hypothetical protein